MIRLENLEVVKKEPNETEYIVNKEHPMQRNFSVMLIRGLNPIYLEKNDMNEVALVL